MAIERNTIVVHLHFLKLLLSLFGSASWWVLEAPLHLVSRRSCFKNILEERSIFSQIAIFRAFWNREALIPIRKSLDIFTEGLFLR